MAPSVARIESALRSAVQRAFSTGDMDNLTVKRVRASVETELELGDGWFKNGGGESGEDWKERSKDVIVDEVEAQERKAEEQKKKGGDGEKKNGEVNGGPRGVKRQSPDETESRRKKARSSPEVTKKDATATEKVEVEDESELSSPLDEDPAKSKRKKSSKKQKTTEKHGSGRPAKASSTEPTLDPDAEEIKRLQGWLQRCGIRKMWFKELAPYSTSKDKIRHLRDMLADVGMTGRYSKEKAEQIREERELKADLEAVQAGEKAWGRGEGDEAEENKGAAGRPKRRLAKGLQELDFLNDDDGDESD